LQAFQNKVDRYRAGGQFVNEALTTELLGDPIDFLEDLNNLLGEHDFGLIDLAQLPELGSEVESALRRLRTMPPEDMRGKIGITQIKRLVSILKLED